MPVIARWNVLALSETGTGSDLSASAFRNKILTLNGDRGPRTRTNPCSLSQSPSSPFYAQVLFNRSIGW